MADLTSIFTSVAVTLGLQGIYFIVMRFPPELRKLNVTLHKLELQEDTTYLITNLAFEQSNKSGSLHTEWLTALSEFGDATVTKEPSEFKAKYLPLLNDRLGALQGTVSKYDEGSFCGWLSIWAEIFEQMRTVTNNLTSDFSIDKSTELEQLKVLEAKLFAQLKLLSLESNMRDLPYQTEIEMLSIDHQDVLRRYEAVCMCLILGAGLLTTALENYISARFHMRRGTDLSFSILLVVGLGLVATIVRRKHFASVMKEIEMLRAKTKKRIEYAHKGFDKYVASIKGTYPNEINEIDRSQPI